MWSKTKVVNSELSKLSRNKKGDTCLKTVQQCSFEDRVVEGLVGVEGGQGIS